MLHEAALCMGACAQLNSKKQATAQHCLALIAAQSTQAFCTCLSADQAVERTLTGKVMCVATFSFHLVPTPKRLRCMISTRGRRWKRSVRVAGLVQAHVSQWNASSPWAWVKLGPA